MLLPWIKATMPLLQQLASKKEREFQGLIKVVVMTVSIFSRFMVMTKICKNYPSPNRPCLYLSHILYVCHYVQNARYLPWIMHPDKITGVVDWETKSSLRNISFTWKNCHFSVRLPTCLDRLTVPPFLAVNWRIYNRLQAGCYRTIDWYFKEQMIFCLWPFWDSVPFLWYPVPAEDISKDL